jgi:3-phenylpropionate/trans-cinnamate dioxygenase ferredoxin subunit
MTSDGFVRVADASAIPDPGKELVEVEDRLLVLIHAGGTFYCIDDVCTHDGGTLGDGELTGHTIACARHGAKFDVRDGRPVTMPATQATAVHQVKVDDGGVYVRIEDN